MPEWLEFLGVPQTQLCEATGLSEAYVKALVKGVEPYNRDLLWVFSCVLNVPPGVLIDIDPLSQEGATMARLLMAHYSAKKALTDH